MARKKIFIHKTSVVDKDVSIGEGTKIWHFSHIMSGVKMGSNCVLGQNVFIGEKVKIGKGVKIQNNVSVFDGVELGDFVFCGPNVTFTNVKKPRAEFSVEKRFDKTIIDRGATIGANATIICPVRIGEYAFIGAGSVVTKDVPDYALVYGIPAREKEHICQCGSKLTNRKKNKLNCSVCSRNYKIELGKVIQV